MLDVLHTVASTRPVHGGPSRSVPFLCEALANREASVRLVTAAPREAVERGDAIQPSDPVRTTIVEERGWLSETLRAPIGFYRTLRDEVDRARPALIHDHGLWLPTNGIAALVARQFGIPLVISTRGMLTDWSLRHHRWKKRLAWAAYQRRVLEQASLFHVTSQEEVDALRDLGFDPPAAVVPNGVPLPRQTNKNGRPRREHRALFLSRLHPKKGLEMLLRAWSDIDPSGWVLELVGPSEDGHRAELESEAARLGVTEQVHFSGPVSDDEKWEVYRRADLFVLPTYSENFGIVVAEALAAGVPVITTTGTPWQALEAHDCGWWVAPRPEAIRRALRHAMGRTDQERRAMGERGRTLVENHYAWDQIAGQLQGAYRWILNEGPRPDCVEH